MSGSSRKPSASQARFPTNAPDPVKDKLKKFGLFAHFGEKSFLPTIGEAVHHYLETHDVDWVDWEDH